jgi:hypothetical protein
MAMISLVANLAFAAESRKVAIPVSPRESLEHIVVSAGV